MSEFLVIFKFIFCAAMLLASVLYAAYLRHGSVMNIPVHVIHRNKILYRLTCCFVVLFIILTISNLNSVVHL